jgi:hypothetical protein
VCFLLGLPEIGARSIVLGQARQPLACGTEGTRLTFVDGHGRELALHATHENGVDLVVSNWAPLPPHDEPSAVPAPLAAPRTDARAAARSVAASVVASVVLALAAAAAVEVAARRRRRAR